MQYMDNKSIKNWAKQLTRGRYGSLLIPSVFVFIAVSIGLSAIVSMLTSSLRNDAVSSTAILTLLGLVISIISGMVEAGFTYMLLKLSANQDAMLSDIFVYFGNNTSTAAHVAAFLGIVTSVISIPAEAMGYIILDGATPGFTLIASAVYVVTLVVLVIFSLTFAMSYCIMADFPAYTARQVLRMSMDIMKGHKGRLFYLQVSFIPLILLTVITCGLAIFWVMPYYQMCVVLFYINLMRNRNMVQ